MLRQDLHVYLMEDLFVHGGVYAFGEWLWAIGILLIPDNVLDQGLKVRTTIVRPVEPNDKVAPPGVGPEHLIAAQEELEYMVRSENYASATAPVQELIMWTTLTEPRLDHSPVWRHRVR